MHVDVLWCLCLLLPLKVKQYTLTVCPIICIVNAIDLKNVSLHDDHAVSADQLSTSAHTTYHNIVN